MTEEIKSSNVPTFASDQLKSSSKGYGENGTSSPASVKVSESADLAKLKVTAKSDPALDAVKSGNYPHDIDWEQRRIDPTPLPTTHGHKNPNVNTPRLGSPKRLVNR